MIREATLEGFDSSDDRIDELCDAFEAAWRDGPRPQILDFVALGGEELRPKLFYELLLVELEYRRKAGEQPTQDAYLERFPEFAREIEAVAFGYGTSGFASRTNTSQAPGGAKSHDKGTRISHYQLVEKIGAGAMGEVWKAVDSRLSRTVAIKLMRTESLTEADLRRFLREGQAAGQLKHPQLAAIHDIGRWENLAYIVVDYVDGENLRKCLDRRKLTHREIVDICGDVAEALSHAHERGVVHRDLKPANIVLDRRGRSHVIDFGLAKWSTEYRDLTIQGELLGTPAYMSPEQARGQGAGAGPATDIYSLGVVLYEMLAGECPFRGDRGLVLHQIQYVQPESPRRKAREVPRDLETICLKALEKDPLRRYSTIQEMAVDLRRFERGEPILTSPPGVAEKAWRWARRHTTLLVAALIAVFAIGVTLLASSLALQNKALQGFRDVGITTNPPGALIVFARLSDIGELLPDQVTRPATTPAEVELLPGDYFVETVWPDGRFHQVLRRVPSGRQAVYSSEDQTRTWSGSGSTIALTSITCPPLDVTDRMDEVSIYDELDAVDTRKSGNTFFADPHDLTVGEVRLLTLRLDGKHIGSPGYDVSNADDSDAVQEPFDLAASLAERLGKRLPTNLEYYRLAEMQIAKSKLSSPAGGKEPAGDNKRRSKTEFIRYTAPYNPKGSIRLVRSTHPLFISVKSND